jgi:hypothetical protein
MEQPARTMECFDLLQGILVKRIQEEYKRGPKPR